MNSSAWASVPEPPPVSIHDAGHTIAVLSVGIASPRLER